MPSAAKVRARTGSPSSSRQSDPSRTSSHARSEQGGSPSSRWRARRSHSWRQSPRLERPNNPMPARRRLGQRVRDLRAPGTNGIPALGNRIPDRRDRATKLRSRALQGLREAHERRAFLQKASRASAQAPRARASSPARYSAGLVEGIGPGFHYRESGSPPNTRTRMRKVSSATAWYRKVPLSTRHSLGSR